jgi:hypothetical protein
LEAEESTTEPPVAVLVCHGMGQQVRYETISSVANAIQKEAVSNGAFVHPLSVHLFKVGENIFTRAEVVWKDTNQQRHEVHVYEAYWAPLTEGRITYWDTVKFLLLAAWNGMKYSKPFIKSTFNRWMFGAVRPLTIGRLTFLGIVCVLLFLAAQLGIISYVSLELAQRYKAFLSQPIPALHFATFSSWMGMWLVPLLPGSEEMAKEALFSHAWWSGVARLGGWVALILEASVARYFIIEFVGDVAAYISPYKASKFDELRQKIQTVGFTIGKVIYGFGGAAPSVPDYRRVVIAGHSLGSVLAYDTLNALINLDNVSAPANRRDVSIRTSALITFGSPLDKTAFIFRMQPDNEEDWIREHLAASVQPLILSYPEFRPSTFSWINLWSPMDIVSGSLEYYDAVRPSNPLHVHNKRDPRAWVPIMAHTQYWKGKLFRKTLYRAVL